MICQSKWEVKMIYYRDHSKHLPYIKGISFKFVLNFKLIHRTTPWLDRSFWKMSFTPNFPQNHRGKKELFHVSCHMTNRKSLEQSIAYKALYICSVIHIHHDICFSIWIFMLLFCVLYFMLLSIRSNNNVIILMALFGEKPH